MTTKTKQLVNRIAGNAGTDRTLAGRVARQFLNEIMAQLTKGSRIEFRGFGIFDTETRPPGAARNPRTPEKAGGRAESNVKSKAGRLMEDRLNARPADHWLITDNLS
jgi:integration host factor subunit beta